MPLSEFEGMTKAKRDKLAKAGVESDTALAKLNDNTDAFSTIVEQVRIPWQQIHRWSLQARSRRVIESFLRTWSVWGGPGGAFFVICGIFAVGVAVGNYFPKVERIDRLASDLSGSTQNETSTTPPGTAIPQQQISVNEVFKSLVLSENVHITIVTQVNSPINKPETGRKMNLLTVDGERDQSNTSEQQPTYSYSLEVNRFERSPILKELQKNDELIDLSTG